MSSKYAIADAAKSCLEAFNKCLEVMSTTPWPDEQLDRFNLWAGNSGILASYDDHISMDWRLRERQDLVEMMLQLLDPLENYLSLIHEFSVSGTGDRLMEVRPAPESTHSSSSSSGSQGDEQPEPKTVTVTLQNYVEETISELFRLSAAIRSAGMSNRYAKAAKYVEYKDGVNLTLKFRQRLAELLVSFIPNATDYMRERLVETISLRQRQLAFTQKQKQGRAKAHEQPKADESGSHKPVPSRSASAYGRQSSSVPSRASSSSSKATPSHGKESRSRKPNQATNYSATDVGSKVSFGKAQARPGIVTGLFRGIDESLQNIPLPPQSIRPTDKQIECPHCTIIMDMDKLRGKNWARHFLEDYRPYVCVLDDCKTPRALFESGSLWMIHMKTDHKASQWTCAAQPHLTPEIFSTEAEFLAHMSSEHSDAFTLADLSHLARFSKQEVPRELDGSVLSICPICAVSLEALEGKIDDLYRHIAQELFDYALLSLKDLPGIMGLLQGESERFPSSNGNGADQGADKRRQSEIEQDVTLPWSKWLAENDEPVPDSPETEAELENLKQDLLVYPETYPEWRIPFLNRELPVHVNLDPICFEDLEEVWESIQIDQHGLQNGLNDPPDRTLQSFIINGKKKAAEAAVVEAAEAAEGAAQAKIETDTDTAPGDTKENKDEEDEEKAGKSTEGDPASLGASLQALKAHARKVTSLTFSPNGRWLASASHDKTIRVWDATNGQLQQTLEGHTDGVTSVAFSPDGQQLASASNDNTVRLWDTREE